MKAIKDLLPTFAYREMPATPYFNVHLQMGLF